MLNVIVVERRDGQAVSSAEHAVRLGMGRVAYDSTPARLPNLCNVRLMVCSLR